ncbi:MAG: hypothetical protein GX995_04265 [Clostridiales bacterium]|nr:hypothetical protein [Clostridiales bacterium]
MNQDTKKTENPNTSIVVDLDVAKVVKSICVTCVIITSIVLGTRLLSKIFLNESDELQ